MLKISIENVSTMNMLYGYEHSKNHYTKETRAKMRSIANKIRKQVGDVKMDGILDLELQVYTKDIRKIDTINVAHLFLNAGNGIGWDDSQAWHLKIDRFYVPDGEERTVCIVRKHGEIAESCLEGEVASKTTSVTKENKS